MMGGIGTVAVLGAGAMGAGIAQVASLSCRTVLLFDAKDGATAAAIRQIRERSDRDVIKGRLSRAVADAMLARLKPVSELSEIAGADLVIEAVVEDLEIKRQLFSQVETIVGSDAILASNTSSLLIAEIGGQLGTRCRFAGLHFFNPVPLMRVVEVVCAPFTEPSVIERLQAFVEDIGHVAVPCIDSPGFIVNHAGRGYSTEALRLLEEGVAEPAAIDRILRATGFKMGPFELFDLTGIDVSASAMESIYTCFHHEARLRPSFIARSRVLNGWLGRKTTRGFYAYDGNSPMTTSASAAPSEYTLDTPVWVDSLADAVPRQAILDRFRASGITIDDGHSPGRGSIAVLLPWGQDLTTTLVGRSLDPGRTVAIDPLLADHGFFTVMRSPATAEGLAESLIDALRNQGVPSELINDSPGFVAQRVLAMVVNIGTSIVEKGIATPDDLDRAVRLALGYPLGPLAWGDMIGPQRVHTILLALQEATGDMRYRPTLWLRRRTQLNLPLVGSKTTVKSRVQAHG